MAFKPLLLFWPCVDTFMRQRKAARRRAERLASVSEFESLVAHLKIGDRLLSTWLRAHPFAARFPSRPESCSQCSAEIIVLPPISGSPAFFIGYLISSRRIFSRCTHDAIPMMHELPTCPSSCLNGGSFTAAGCGFLFLQGVWHAQACSLGTQKATFLFLVAQIARPCRDQNTGTEG